MTSSSAIRMHLRRGSGGAPVERLSGDRDLVLALVLSSGHVAVAPEHRALGDDDLGSADVAGQAAGGLDLHAVRGLTVARDLAAHADGTGGDAGPHLAAGTHVQVFGDADLALDVS